MVSYNVRDLLGDRDAVARVVGACRPDVLCLQEAPRRLGTLHRTARLVRDTGLRHVVGGRGSGGTAVLVASWVDVPAREAGRLPVAHLWTRTRGYALARLRLPDGVELTVASVHLPLQVDDRLHHSRRVRERLRALTSGPVVVCGDLNEPPDGPSWAALGELYRDPVAKRSPDPAVTDAPTYPAVTDAPTYPAVTDAPTYPAKAPRHRIDGVLVSAGVGVLALRPAGAPDGLTRDDLVSASDHLPLLADLHVAAGPQGEDLFPASRRKSSP